MLVVFMCLVSLQDIYTSFCNLDSKGMCYSFEVSLSGPALELHNCMAKLLSHPLQRPSQSQASYSLLEDDEPQEVEATVWQQPPPAPAPPAPPRRAPWAPALLPSSCHKTSITSGVSSDIHCRMSVQFFCFLWVFFFLFCLFVLLFQVRCQFSFIFFPSEDLALVSCCNVSLPDTSVVACVILFNTFIFYVAVFKSLFITLVVIILITVQNECRSGKDRFTTVFKAHSFRMSGVNQGNHALWHKVLTGF